MDPPPWRNVIFSLLGQSHSCPQERAVGDLALDRGQAPCTPAAHTSKALLERHTAHVGCLKIPANFERLSRARKYYLKFELSSVVGEKHGLEVCTPYSHLTFQ